MPKHLGRGLLLLVALIVSTLTAACGQLPGGRSPLANAVSLSDPADQRILFIGNSFTSHHQLPLMTARMMEAVVPDWTTVYAASVAPGGYRLIEHLRDVENSDANPRLRQLLVTGSDSVREWDLVILQEQSQVPGFRIGNDSKDDSLWAGEILQSYIRDTGATTMLYQTWGYLDGDPLNPQLFPTYFAMQDDLATGYYQLQDRMWSLDSPVYMAPVGWGFLAVHDDVADGGTSPQSGGSLFHRLYADDDKHPGLAGSYLAASIITAAYSGRRVAPVAWRPPGIDEKYARYLREVAERVVFDHEIEFHDYPWS